MYLNTDEEYMAALKKVEALMLDPSTTVNAELDALVTAIEAFENRHFPNGHPSP